MDATHPSLADWIRRHATHTPDATAYLVDEERVSWADYEARSQRLARLLANRGLAPTERLAVLLPDGPGVHIAFVAAEKAGLVAVGLSPRAGRSEIAHLLRTTGASALVSRGRHRGDDMSALVDELRGQGLPLRLHLVVEGELAETDPIHLDGRALEAPPASDAIDDALEKRRLRSDDLFLLNSTSGTTGMPKCVSHDQRRWMAFHEFAVDAGELSSADVFMSAVPTPFGFGIWTSHVTPTLLGVPTVLLPQFSALETLRAIERHRVTFLAAVTTQFILMLEAMDSDPAALDCDLSSLRVLSTGGEAVPYERAAQFEERSGACVLQFYGSNETGAVSRTTLRDPRDKRLRTSGRPIPEMQVRLFDEAGNDVTASGEGQPGCKGPTLSAGYYGDPAANAQLIREDGWMLLGDRVRIDAEGYLHVIGRIDDFIIRGGKNISGPGVEQQVATHPAVVLAAAVAMPDPIFGERVCVYAELRPGASLTLEELTAHLASRGVSKETFPEHLVVVDELPRSSGGKLAKKQLREDIRRRMEAQRPPAQAR
jgi:acyl-CoA synthetase